MTRKRDSFEVEKGALDMVLWTEAKEERGADPLCLATGRRGQEGQRSLSGDGVSQQAVYSWKRRYADLGLNDLRELRQLRGENRKLKRIVADREPLFSGHGEKGGPYENAFDWQTSVGQARCYTSVLLNEIGSSPGGAKEMKLSNLLPSPLRKFVRERMTVFVYTYGFRPSPSIEQQVLTFAFANRKLTVEADHRTALYDMILEVVDYDCYQLSKLAWEPVRHHNILDIGANVGVTGLVLAQIPGARVTCYEPDPGNCALLRGNVDRNGLRNIAVREAAVGLTNGKLQFKLNAESTGGALATNGSGRDARTLTVDAITLDRAVEEASSPGDTEIALLKCDCEGGEYDLLMQLTPTLASRIRNLTIEVHDLDTNRNVEWVSNKLSGLGYEVSCIPDLWERAALHLVLARRLT
jgi:FkbM family methyltransferase